LRAIVEGFACIVILDDGGDSATRYRQRSEWGNTKASDVSKYQVTAVTCSTPSAAFSQGILPANIQTLVTG
jgi:hypothetical protein